MGIHRQLAVAAALLLAVGTVAVTGTAAYALGTTWWVDGSSAACSNSGPGTQATPFCTISTGAVKATHPGDTVQVLPATYREQITVAGSGTPTDPISIIGNGPGVIVLGTQDVSAGVWSSTATNAWSMPYAPPSAPKQVFLDGQRLAAATSPTTTTSGSYYYDSTVTPKLLYVDIGGPNPGDGHVVEAGAQSFGANVSSRHDVVVRGFDFRRQNFAGARVLSSSSVLVQNITASESAANGVLVDTCPSSGVVVDQADVSGSLSTGIKLSATSGATVSASTSHGNGLHGIGLATSSSNLITGNTAYGNTSLNPNATAAGIDVNTTSPNNTVRGNTLHNNQDTGVQVYSGSNGTVVARNVSYSNGDHGFDTLNATAVKYVNNTAYANHRDGISVEGSSTGASLANNVLMNNGLTTNEYDIYVDLSSVSGFSADYDIAYNSTAASAVRVGTTVYKKLTNYATASGQESHGLAVDPAFVNAASTDYRLAAGSAGEDSANASAAGFDPVDAAGSSPVDDPIVNDTGAGTPTYADRGALEFQPSGQQEYAPHAALVLDPQSVSVPPGASVTADASGSTDSDLTGLVSYTFDFGDGTVVGPQTSPVAVHVFRTVGTFTVQVTVQDSAGLTDSATAQESVSARTLQTYHVEQTNASCSDAGPGTTATPFCTITQATRVALAGDTVLVGAGQYREQVGVTKSGESGAPVTYQATTPSAVILGTDDVSDPATWSPTSTNAWKRTFAPAAVPAQVFLDNQPLVKAPSATQTTTGTWFYDAATTTLYVDNGGANPATGHTIAAGARNYGFLVRQVTDVVVDGFTVKQQNITGVYLDRSDNSTVKNVVVSRASSHGITVDGSSGVTVTGVDSSTNGSIGVRFFDSADSKLATSVTHNNSFYGVSVQGSRRIVVTGVTSYANLKPGQRIAAGIDVSQSSVDCVVEGNTTYGNDDSGIEAYTGSTGTVIRRNLSYDNGDHGIDDFSATGSVVLSNTVVSNETAGINFEGGSSGATVRDNVTLNNAVGSTRTIGEIRVDESSEPGISMDRDLVFQTSGGPLFEWSSQPYTTLAAFTAVSGKEAAGINANPQFTNLAGRDLRLTGTSPAIDAADSAVSGWRAADAVGTSPVDHPFVADSGSGPVPFADLGALEYAGPGAKATITPTNGVAPLDVTVDASATVALGAPISSYSVQCGNGTTASQQVSHCIYPSIGTFTITLTVTDGAGLRDSLTKIVTVSTDFAPVAKLTATPAQAYVPQDVTLDASGSTDTDSTPIATYAFTCGNGQSTGPQAGATTTCNYTKSGNFTASVTVKDTAGLSSTKNLTVKILADAAPNADLQLSSAKITRGQSITADASGSTDVDKTGIALTNAYRFDCGNGTVIGQQTSPTMVCTYPNTGTFKVQVWVTDTLGLVGTQSKNVQVQK